MNANGTLFDYLIGRFRETQRLARSRAPVRAAVTPGHRSARAGAAAGKLFRQLRREFIERLESVLGRRSERVRRFEALAWLDDEGRLGNVQVIHCNPIIRSDTPLVLTLSLNCLGAGVSRACLKRLGWRGWPYFPEHSRKPSMSVKASPEEVLLFVLWAVRLVQEPERDIAQDLPVPCCSWDPSVEFGAQGIWTVEAREEVAAYEEARNAVGGGDAA